MNCEKPKRLMLIYYKKEKNDKIFILDVHNYMNFYDVYK